MTTTEAPAGPAGPGGPAGLDEAEAADRASRGLVNHVPQATSRTLAAIIRANVFTRFNAILATLLVVILTVGPLQDALFGVVLVLNTAVGIAQEWRAKRTLDRLSLLSAPSATVMRSGRPRDVPVGDVVWGDVVELRQGAQVVADGPVLRADGLEVDESLLTGESRPEAKAVGDEVLSGSFVSAGHGWQRADRVGADAYAPALATEARRFSLVASELRQGTDRILRLVTWLILPTAALLVASQLVSDDSLPDAVRGTVAGVGAMIPEGLVLLTTLAFTAAALRLGRRRVLVQELAAIEVLARVDVVCIDKTGTITEPGLDVVAVDPVARGADIGGADVGEVLGALAAVDPEPNATLSAIAARFPAPGWEPTWRVAFSSARKFSGAGFAGRGDWVLGAADVLLRATPPQVSADAVAARVDDHTHRGRRVLLLGRLDGPPGPGAGDAAPPARPVAVIAIEERIRPEAAETLGYLRDQGVTVKVVSGDDPRTVAAVAARVGIPGTEHPVDARRLPEDGPELAAAATSATVLGRVGPHQKRAIVRALQAEGRVVAMTGDGVNDVLALKEADLGVAMGSGSAASRSVAPLVLLDSSFASLPPVLAEGRRVIANVERVANLFLTKTTYATLIALAVGVARLPFPFLPRHLTIIGGLTIGIPAFFLALAPNRRRYEPGFVARVLRFAVPAGAVAAVATVGAYALARVTDGTSRTEARTVATITLFLVGLWVLGILARPTSPWRAGLVLAMGAAFAAILATPPLRDPLALDVPTAPALVPGLLLAAAACAVLTLLVRLTGGVRRG